MSDQPDAETTTWQHTEHNRQTSMPLVGFEHTIPASERPQTYVLNSTATGTDKITITQIKNCYEKLTIGRILFKLDSFTNFARQSHSSPAKQIEKLQYNHEPIQLHLPTSGWLMVYTYGSSLPITESHSILWGCIAEKWQAANQSLYQALLGFMIRH
jgi:hypothetical protein